MKKIVTICLCMACLWGFVSCGTAVKDYGGTPVTLLSYERIDYMGGYTETYVIDFEANVVQKRGYLPSENDAPDFETIATFSDEAERILINKLFSYGLFDIKDNYPAPEGIIDGGGWNLSIEYSDGTLKKSSGSNNSPASVFSNCAKAFYDIFEDGIVGYVPQNYYCPPNISYSFTSGSTHMGYTSYGERVDYRWNGFESADNNIYEINISNDLMQEFHEGDEYILVLYTANYGDYEKFQKCVVTEYDFNEELTNPTEVYSGKWFKQIEIDLDLNKIYMVRFEFKDGDFVEYTFNTRITSGD